MCCVSSISDMAGGIASGRLQTHLGRDHREQLVDRAGADRGEHRGLVFGRVVEVGHRDVGRGICQSLDA